MGRGCLGSMILGSLIAEWKAVTTVRAFTHCQKNIHIALQVKRNMLLGQTKHGDCNKLLLAHAELWWHLFWKAWFFYFSLFNHTCIKWCSFNQLKWIIPKLSSLWKCSVCHHIVCHSSFNRADFHKGLKVMNDWLNVSHFVCIGASRHSAFVYWHLTKGYAFIAFSSRK